MDRGAREALTALALAACASGVAAQNPPTVPPAPPRDSLAREQIYNDIIPPRAAFAPRIPLVEGQVYRVEIQPATATVAVRSAGRPTLPPLFMVPLAGGGGGASETAAFLIVPRATEEYRFDVTVHGTEPVRLRVETDPREMSRYARMREATKDLPAAGVGLRAVYLGAFVRPRLTSGASAGMASAYGVEGCLAVVPSGAWLSGPIGGCVLAIGRLVRPDSAGGLWVLSLEPRYQFSAKDAPLQQSVVLTLSIATSVGQAAGTLKTDYVAFGLSYHVATRWIGRHVFVEAEAGLARLQVLGDGIEPLGRASIVPHLAAGLQLRY